MATTHLCARCAQLDIAQLDENDVVFQDNLATLQSSAEQQGCAFCVLAWDALQGQVRRDRLDSLLRGESPWRGVDSWTRSIWLHGQNLHSRGRFGAQIAISCGRLPGTAGDFPDCNPSANAIMALLEVYAVAGRPSRYRLYGRSRADEPTLTYATRWIQRALRTCRDQHRRCATADGGVMPTRVLDVGEPGIVRLVAGRPRGLCEPYVALSYCWGPSTAETVRLTTATGADLAAGMDLTRLNATHQDAVAVVRALGHRYVWIDALCIVQDSQADWEREARSMFRVYRDAALTLVAGRSADARLGFVECPALAAVARRGVRPCQLPVDRSEAAPAAPAAANTLMVGRPRSMATGPVAARAWCFQESLASRRLVIFAMEQLSFRCLECAIWENGTISDRINRPAFLDAPEDHGDGDDAQRRQQQHAATLDAWYRLLYQYTACSLTQPGDIFAAIMSLAQPAARVLRARYLAGLWECDMVRGLLWRPCHQVNMTDDGPLRRPATGAPRAPSWSWAAVEGRIVPYSAARGRKATGAASAAATHEQIRPLHVGTGDGRTSQARWSLDRSCSVDALHMPACTLQLVGRPGLARVLSAPVAAYVSQRRHRGRVIITKRTQDYGVLLAPATPAVDAAAAHPQSPDKVCAIGFFDVTDEQQGVDAVWCLPVVPDMGLLLQEKQPAEFVRLGWYSVEDADWFEGLRTAHIKLS